MTNVEKTSILESYMQLFMHNNIDEKIDTLTPASIEKKRAKILEFIIAFQLLIQKDAISKMRLFFETNTKLITPLIEPFESREVQEIFITEKFKESAIKTLMSG